MTFDDSVLLAIHRITASGYRVSVENVLDGKCFRVCVFEFLPDDEVETIIVVSGTDIPYLFRVASVAAVEYSALFNVKMA